MATNTIGVVIIPLWLQATLRVGEVRGEMNPLALGSTVFQFSAPPHVHWVAERSPRGVLELLKCPLTDLSRSAASHVTGNAVHGGGIGIP